MNDSSQRAFSLVELSIVLVILGLLTGGILSGQSLIRASELRSVVSDYNRYLAATQTFRDKYFALPGDMTNATAFWGAVSGSCTTTASTTPLTCNGDGDGKIGGATSTGTNEAFRFWQHLANAGLIEGQYDGITHGTNAFSATTANSPRGRISSSLWFVWNWGIPMVSQTVWFDGDYGNRFAIGTAAANSEPSPAMFKPEEAWNVDTKLDDGKPATGKVMSQTTCTDTLVTSNMSASYALTTTSPICSLIFARAF